MCFYTKGSKLRIATKDIVCYKVMNLKKRFGKDGKLKNIYMPINILFCYEEGRNYGEKSLIKMFLRWLHKEIITDEGYYSYSISPEEIKDKFYGSRYRTIVKCIIPKGSLYLHDTKAKVYCSTNIKIIGKVQS